MGSLKRWFLITRRKGKKKGKKKGMQQSKRKWQDAQMREAAYRRGYTQATDEATRLVFHLAELGYKPVEIKRLLAVYDDHFLSAWGASDLDRCVAPPIFNLEQCQEILKHTTGYDWMK